MEDGQIEVEFTMEPAYDRRRKLEAFDDTKAGVKGLVDSGINKVPRIFIQTPDEIADTSESENL